MFTDALFFEEVENVTLLKFNPARKTGEINLEHDKHWESATLGSLRTASLAFADESSCSPTRFSRQLRA